MDLYRGQSHRQILQGIRDVRRVCDVELSIISAKHGIVAEHDLLEPYDATFQGLAPKQCRAAGHALGLNSAVKAWLREPVDHAIVAIGGSYAMAAGLDTCQPVTVGGPTAMLASGRRPVPCTVRRIHIDPTVDAGRLSVSRYALIGAVAARYLRSLVDQLPTSTSVGQGHGA